MPGPQRSNADWDKFDAGPDSDSDTDSAIVRRRVPPDEATPDEATPDEYRWLGDEREDLGRVASVLARRHVCAVNRALFFWS